MNDIFKNSNSNIDFPKQEDSALGAVSDLEGESVVTKWMRITAEATLTVYPKVWNVLNERSETNMTGKQFQGVGISVNIYLNMIQKSIKFDDIGTATFSQIGLTSTTEDTKLGRRSDIAGNYEKVISANEISKMQMQQVNYAASLEITGTFWYADEGNKRTLVWHPLVPVPYKWNFQWNFAF